MIENKYGISYTLPKVFLLQETGLGTSEYAARTCYDSFESSENPEIDFLNQFHAKDKVEGIEAANAYRAILGASNHIEHSDLLDTLAWTHFHHSILEHANLTFLIKGTSRGVLQEHARHRIQAISVRSTRYTMSSVINAFVTAITVFKDYSIRHQWFLDKMNSFDMLVTGTPAYNLIEINGIFEKLMYQYNELGKVAFLELAVAKSSLPLLNSKLSLEEQFRLLENGKNKRNVGDAFKHIVTDNFRVDMVVTFNLRSLKNYYTLRDSGAAYFQIKWLAQAMKAATPKKYLDLIVKEK